MMITLREEKIELLPEKALYWPKPKILVVADLHLGKAAAFRSAGIPIPEGDMQRDLDRLQKIIEAKGAERCIIVGDLFHHRTGMGEHTLNVIETWMENLPCALDLILGNHDIALKSIPHGHWKLRVHPQTLSVKPFVFSHHPCESLEGYVFCGHVHPQAAVKVGNKANRFPCFYFRETCGILPAFSSFAGGVTMDKNEGQAYICAGKEVLLVR